MKRTKMISSYRLCTLCRILLPYQIKKKKKAVLFSYNSSCNLDDYRYALLVGVFLEKGTIDVYYLYLKFKISYNTRTKSLTICRKRVQLFFFYYSVKSLSKSVDFQFSGNDL